MRVRRAGWCAVLLCLACDPGPDGPTLDLPARPSDAPGGAEIAADIRTLDVAAREARVYAEVVRGNMPSWFRRLERVELSGEVDGQTRRMTFWVAPDYLAVGSDDDYLYIPLSPRTALRIADLAGASLPTPRMVDAIWAAARVRLIPIRIPPDEFMGTMRYFERHNRLVQAQRRQHGAPLGAFVAGHKLDIVLPTAPVAEPADVAIYGWHLRNGRPIQPLYRVAMDNPPHFSMGIRLVHRDVLIDGAREDLAAVLHDPELAPFLAR